MKKTVVGISILAFIFGALSISNAAKAKLIESDDDEIVVETKKKTKKSPKVEKEEQETPEPSKSSGKIKPLGESDIRSVFTKKVKNYHMPLTGSADWSQIKAFAKKKYGKSGFDVRVSINSTLNDASFDLSSVIPGRQTVAFLQTDGERLYMDVFTDIPKYFPKGSKEAKSAQKTNITILRFDFGPVGSLKASNLVGKLVKMGELESPIIGTTSTMKVKYDKNLKEVSKAEKKATITLKSA